MKSLRQPGSSAPTIIHKITRHLYNAELFLTGLLTFGILLPKMEVDSSLIVVISVFGLAVVFFLQAYNPVLLPIRSAQMGFRELFSLTVLPKIIWIATSVCTIGILLFLLDINDAYYGTLLIGETALVAGLLIAGYFSMRSATYAKIVMPMLYRAVPVLLISTYILLS
jgi:hypothetical protein